MENKAKIRYESSPEKENILKNIVSEIKTFKEFLIKQILIPKNIKDNCENMMKGINEKNICPSPKPMGQKKILSKNTELTTDSQETRMDIEVAGSNQLIDSLSTKASNNIKSSIESKNLNICNTNMIFFADKK